MDNIWFFNRYGEAKILLNDGSRFIDRQGYNLGYIRNNLVYNYQGRHCGWIEGYVVRDLHGFVVGFSKISNDSPSPIFPIPQIPPIPEIPQIPPIPEIPQIPEIKPIKQFGWSELGLISLFK
jgi:hypothetical protein